MARPGRLAMLCGWVGALAGGLALAAVPPPPPAFPGAEGCGAFARGGRGGDVYHVTSLADSGPGTLRAGIAGARGPRTVVFDTAGTIHLRSELKIERPYLTLAGQTAPGGGVAIAGFGVVVTGTHDVVVRFLRFRPGDLNCPRYQGDALGVVGSHDVILDHVSASWSVDEVLSITHSDRVTVQWSIIAESLNRSCHAKGRHGYGSLLRWGNGSLSFHHNLFAHNASRNPRLGDDLALDFVNNVVYDWGEESGYSGPAGEGAPRLNCVANAFVAGPATSAKRRATAFRSGSARTAVHQSGNLLDADPAPPHQLAAAGAAQVAGEHRAVPARFPLPAVSTDDTETAYRRVLELAGASLRRDAADAAVVRSVAGRSGGLIDSQRQIGGWPQLEGGAPPLDTDGDGAADAWEREHGLDPGDPADAGATGESGTTPLERYLAALAAARERPAGVDR